MTRLPAAAAGAVVAAVVTAAVLLAWADGSPLVPRDGGAAAGKGAPLFLVMLVLAYGAYLCGLRLLRRGSRVAVVAALAAAIQFAPLAAPLLLSTDAWTYWSYGWIASEGGNPYVEPPSSRQDNPALPHMGAVWQDTTSVYGPLFTLASEPVAELAGDDEDVAAWIAKALAAFATLLAALFAGRLARDTAVGLAFVGWNPVLAVHAAGGGHNDAWLGALMLAALALERTSRPRSAGLVWAVAILVKWAPLPLLGLRLLSPATAQRGRLAVAAAASLATLGAISTWRYGADWLGVAGPLAENAARETSYALPARLEQVGLPGPVAVAVAVLTLTGGLVVLARQALRGRARLAAAACLILLTTPYLAAWYLLWAVPLAASEDDDRLARACCLALGAYLLPQAIPL